MEETYSPRYLDVDQEHRIAMVVSHLDEDASKDIFNYLISKKETRFTKKCLWDVCTYAETQELKSELTNKYNEGKDLDDTIPNFALEIKGDSWKSTEEKLIHNWQQSPDIYTSPWLQTAINSEIYGEDEFYSHRHKLIGIKHRGVSDCIKKLLETFIMKLKITIKVKRLQNYL